MALKIKKAQRKSKPLRLLIAAQSGGGKTLSSLMIANGLLHETPYDERKILVFDTEAGRASLKTDYYENFDVIEFDAKEEGRNVSSRDYIDAIKLAEQEGYQVIILDSTTPEWQFVTEMVNSMTGNSVANWGKAKAKYHDPFVDAILHSSIHVILTARSRMSVTLDERGKPKSVGLDTKQESDLPYFMDFVFNIEDRETHKATAEKDESRNFLGKGNFVITEDTGRKIVEWLNGGASSEAADVIKYQKISNPQNTDRIKKVIGITGQGGMTVPPLIKKVNPKAAKAEELSEEECSRVIELLIEQLILSLGKDTDSIDEFIPSIGTETELEGLRKFVDSLKTDAQVEEVIA